ncbi:MAG: YbaB/EbfC family nucleoid-associated protein [Aestuariivita sp.]|nr:YbaB/EbfC family nucleoid-associated protein [Aestuariivita sp.]
MSIPNFDFSKINDMMGEFAQLASKLKEKKKKLEKTIIDVEAGGGLIKVKINLLGVLEGIEIDPSILVASEKELVEDLLLAAIKSAEKTAKKRMKAEMSEITDGFDMPDALSDNLFG